MEKRRRSFDKKENLRSQQFKKRQEQFIKSTARRKSESKIDCRSLASLTYNEADISGLIHSLENKTDQAVKVKTMKI